MTTNETDDFAAEFDGEAGDEDTQSEQELSGSQLPPGGVGDEIDLSQFDDDCDWENTPDPEPSYGQVPNGKYQVRVEKIYLATSSSGNPMLKWQLHILGPKMAGRKLFRNNMLTSPDNREWLRKDLCAAGVSPKKVSDLQRPGFLEQLLDVILEVVVKNKDEESTNVYIQRRIDSAAPNGTGTGTDPDLNEESVF